METIGTASNPLAIARKRRRPVRTETSGGTLSGADVDEGRSAGTGGFHLHQKTVSALRHRFYEPWIVGVVAQGLRVTTSRGRSMRATRV